jgi:hypothetical protein
MFGLGTKSAKYAMGNIKRTTISTIKAKASIGLESRAKFVDIGAFGCGHQRRNFL